MWRRKQVRSGFGYIIYAFSFQMALNTVTITCDQQISYSSHQGFFRYFDRDRTTEKLMSISRRSTLYNHLVFMFITTNILKSFSDLFFFTIVAAWDILEATLKWLNGDIVNQSNGKVIFWHEQLDINLVQSVFSKRY